MAKEVRIDKWLWAVRIFKTRTVSTDACKKGRVTINGVTVKPSRPLKEGEVVDVKKPPITYTFRVIGLIENRVGAKLVPNYYENITAPDQYELLEMIKVNGFVNRQKGLGRPTKKEGRELARFTDESYMGFDYIDEDFLLDMDEDEDEKN
ncbi:MAG: RNA-binding S4 domain-containing protein [Muribaculaceae bacterium]|nr:RNA-binding S4 domain-containing protein [Muribaculaceae bacterium]